MNKNGSLYYLGVGIFAVGIAEILMTFLAVLMRDTASVFAFGGGAVLSCFAGVALLLATKGSFERIGRLDSILLLVYFWVIIPVFAAIPFYSFLGSFIKAYVEAVSALTTTGASVVDYNRYIPKTIFLWRSLLGWSGGLLSITMVLLILAPFGVGGLQDKSSKFLGNRYDKNNNFAPILTMVGGAYSLISVILIVALMMGGARSFDAVNLIFSTISTTGYNQHASGFGYFDSGYTAFIVMLSMFTGAGLIIVFFRQFISAKSRLSFNIEVKLFVIITVFYALIITLYRAINTQAGLVEAVKYYFYALFDTVSILSTTGIIYNTDWQPITFYYALAFIGGASFTTAGGMKLFRFLIFIRHSRIEISQLTFPNSVSSNRFLDMRLDTKFMRLIWSFFIAYLFFDSGIGNHYSKLW